MQSSCGSTPDQFSSSLGPSITTFMRLSAYFRTSLPWSLLWVVTVATLTLSQNGQGFLNLLKKDSHTGETKGVCGKRPEVKNLRLFMAKSRGKKVQDVMVNSLSGRMGRVCGKLLGTGLQSQWEGSCWKQWCRVYRVKTCGEGRCPQEDR